MASRESKLAMRLFRVEPSFGTERHEAACGIRGDGAAFGVAFFPERRFRLPTTPVERGAAGRAASGVGMGPSEGVKPPQGGLAPPMATAFASGPGVFAEAFPEASAKRKETYGGQGGSTKKGLPTQRGECNAKGTRLKTGLDRSRTRVREPQGS